MTDFSSFSVYDGGMSALVESTTPGPAVDPRPSPSRRSRKKSRTYAALVEAGAELFASRGFDETTTVDIAERWDAANVGPAVEDLLSKAQPLVKVYGA